MSKIECESESEADRERASGSQGEEKNDTTNRQIFEIIGSMKACPWYVFDIKQNTKPKPFLPALLPLCFIYHERRRGKKWAVKFNRCNHILWIFSSPQFWLFSSGWKVEEKTTTKYIRQFGIYSFVQSLVNRFWIMAGTEWCCMSQQKIINIYAIYSWASRVCTLLFRVCKSHSVESVGE